MPLVDLQTNLKSLKYGRDRLNGGSSGEPFISKDIDGLKLSDLHRTGGSDLLIRGGFLLGDRIKDDVERLTKYFRTTEGQIWSVAQNVLSTSGVRIYGGYDLTTRVFRANKLNDGTYLPTSTLAQIAGNPLGLHLNKQGADPTGLTVFRRPEYVELQKDLAQANLNLGGGSERNRLLRLTKRHRTSPTFTSKKREFTNVYSYLGGPGAGTLVGGPARTTIRFADQRTGNWSVKKRYFELAQYQGSDLTWRSNYNQILANSVSEVYGLDNDINNQISSGDNLPYNWSTAPFNLNTQPNKFFRQAKNISNQINFDNTVSASGSVFSTESGRETSLYSRYVTTRDGENYDSTLDESHPSLTQNTATKQQQAAGNNATLTADEIVEVANPDNRIGSILDFRRKVKKKNNSSTRKNGSLTNSLNWSDTPSKRIETRVRLGDPGNPNIDRSDYTKGGGIFDSKGNYKPSIGTDRINALYMYKSETPAQTSEINDLVKFRFAVIDPDNPKEATYIHFRAFLENMSDSFNAEWNKFRYLGRAENFYNYQGFERSIRLSWVVAAQSKEELSIQYQKLNYLASTLAPNYSKDGFMRGNIHRLTVGAYVYEYPGIIESLDYTIPDNSPWEIAIPSNPRDTSRASGNVSSDASVKELPHRIEVSMTFRPINKFLPQTVQDPFAASTGGTVRERFLSLEDSTYSGSYNLYTSNEDEKYNAIPAWSNPALKQSK